MSQFRLVIALVFAISVFSGLAHADQNISFKLEDESAGAASSDAKKIGKVGVVITEKATIRISKSSRSKAYSTVKKDTPLAIVKSSDATYYGVLMVNGNVGFIEKSKVKLTDYDLVADKPASGKRGSFSARGGYARDGSWQQKLIDTALSYSWVRYVYGGNNPDTGMDCSAFMKMVYKKFGVNLPRTARSQAKVGTTVAFDKMEPGDRLYFQCKKSHIDHCGIYMGNGQFVHCTVRKNGVAVDSLSNDFYWNSLVVAKR